MNHFRQIGFVCILGLSFIHCTSDQIAVRFSPIQKGWAGNSINTVIFRKNSVVTHEQTQFVSFYDDSGRVILAKRNLDSSDWQIQTTQYKGNIRDAHNSISIIVDGEGYLHMAWNHHNSPLLYCKSQIPGSLTLTEPQSMIGLNENKVSYPEFYRLPYGNLLFLYRDGASGRGNLMMNLYQTSTKTWSRLQNNLISGEEQRNAYWQASVDKTGNIHLSWVWRETWDVATNHDLCYAKSLDGGLTWQKSTGETYALPITAETAEYAWRIPQKSELINQTSMCVDGQGHPIIATYWRPEGTDVPQYHVVFYDGQEWQVSQVTQRITPFSLSGGGTKRIPISRPQILADDSSVHMVFRDAESGDCVSLASCHDLKNPDWKIKHLTETSVGQWEPTYDTELWMHGQKLHLFIQNVGQGDTESVEQIEAQMAGVLEWEP